jgi:hypothetical protein
MYRDTSNNQYLQSYSQCGLAACADNSVSEKGFLSCNHTVGACHIVRTVRIVSRFAQGGLTDHDWFITVAVSNARCEVLCSIAILREYQPIFVLGS